MLRCVTAVLLLHSTAALSASHTGLVPPKATFGALHTHLRSGDSGLVHSKLEATELPKLKLNRLVASAQDPAAATQSAAGQLLSVENLKLALYLGVWYLGNIYYNLFNKYASNALGKDAHGHSNAHWVLSAAQLLVGVLFVAPQWLLGIRDTPALSAHSWGELAPIGLFSALSHALSVVAMGAGAVSFAQIVKSAEPVFAAASNAGLLGDVDHPLVYAALIPIIGGVGLASLKELSFTVTALVAASLANQAAAFKNVVSKGVMRKDWAKSLGPQNTFALVNLLAMLSTLPFALLFDAKDIGGVYKQVMASGQQGDVLKYTLLSGLSFYIYNEASFLALSRLSPVSHSVANTLKRVIIIVASCIVFQTPMSLMGGVGSAIAVLGTLLYSLAKRQYGGAAH